MVRLDASKINLRLIAMLVLILLTLACSDKTTSADASSQKKGVIPLKISLAPLQQLEVTVTEAIATVSKGSEKISNSLEISNNSANGSIAELNPGVWQLEVELYSNEYVVAFGEAEVEVFPGENSVVNLTMVINDLTGSIEIIVEWEVNQPQPERFLFIGNSYTYFNDGVDQMFRSVAQSTDENLRIEVQAITGGGLTLQNHFENPTTQATILTGNWDVVILQEQSQMPIFDTPRFLTYAAKLDSLINLSGAQTCFFMTWAREYEQTQIVGLSEAYLTAGELLNAQVVPVGQLFNYVYEDNPEISLYISDGSHPSWQGTYLASLCFYQTVYNSSAQNVEFVSFGVTNSEAEYLQESVNEWYLVNRKAK